MISLKYYNYSQIGGNDLQTLVKKCNGLNVITASVVDDDFTININDEQQKDEIEIYNRIKSLKDQNKELEVGVMMKNKRNKFIWNKWSKKRGDKTNYELFNEALEASRSSTPGSSTPVVGKLKLPTGFKLPGASSTTASPTTVPAEYATYAKMKKAGIPKPAVVDKIKRELDKTEEEAQAIYDSLNTASPTDSPAASPTAEYATYAKMKKAGIPKPAVVDKIKRELDKTEEEAQAIYDSLNTASPIASPTDSPAASPTRPSRPAFLAGIERGTTFKKKKKPKAKVEKPTVEDFLKSEGKDNFNREEYEIYLDHVKKPEMIRQMIIKQYEKEKGDAKSEWDKLFTDKGIPVIPPRDLEDKYSPIHDILQRNGDKYKPLSGGYYTILYSV